MTPEQMARAALCLADALYTISDETRRDDLCADIVIGAKADAEALWGGLVHERERYDFPAWSFAGPPDAVEASADAWRTWGENLRASIAACPVCEEPKGEPPGPMCADLHQAQRMPDDIGPSSQRKYEVTW